jgi:hypothetical protein
MERAREGRRVKQSVLQCYASDSMLHEPGTNAAKVSSARILLNAPGCTTVMARIGLLAQGRIVILPALSSLQGASG